MRIRRTLAVMGIAVAVLAISACSKKEDKVGTQTATESTAGVAVKDIKKPKSYGKVTLGKYKGIDLSIQDMTVSNEEVDERIDSMLAASPNKEEITDRAVQNGDTVNIDYVGTIDGVAFDGGTAQGQELVIGSGTYIPGFEDGLIGVNKGETKDINVKFPENYQSTDLAGKGAIFSVTVNSIAVETPAELTDEWVNEYTSGVQKTVAEFKVNLKEELEKSKKLNSDLTAQESAITAVIADSKFEVNEEAVEYEYNEWLKQFKEAAENYGMSFEDFASMYGMTVEAMQTDLKNNADSVVKRIILVDEIIKAENLKMEDDDYTFLAEYQGSTVEDLKENYDKATLERAVRNIKAARFIVDNANKTVLQSLDGLELNTETKQ